MTPTVLNTYKALIILITHPAQTVMNHDNKPKQSLMISVSSIWALNVIQMMTKCAVCKVITKDFHNLNIYLNRPIHLHH